MSDVQPALEPVPEVRTAPVRQSRAGTVVLAGLGLLLAGLALVLVFVYLATFIGPVESASGLVLALIPLLVVLRAIAWVDRWDPEPRPALWFAFLWGAGVSIVTALLFDLGVQITIAASGGALAASSFASTVIQAPFVEEIAKGVGVLVLFWVARRHFDGPVDGVVYAATIAAGFAFSENIQYFGVALMEGGAGSLGMTFLVRGVFSPFAHVMFTMCTGLALGLAARRTSRRSHLVYFVLGLVPAIALHALWNGATFVFVDGASLLSYYLFVQVPLFIVAVVVVVRLRRREARVTLRRLHEYSVAGWFTAAEVSMLATATGRRQALAWAKAQPVGRTRAMRRFITDATRLAFAREHLVNGHDGPIERAHEADLLGALQQDRAELLAPA